MNIYKIEIPTEHYFSDNLQTLTTFAKSKEKALLNCEAYQVCKDTYFARVAIIDDVVEIDKNNLLNVCFE